MRRHPLHPTHLLTGLAVGVLVLAGASPAGATGNGAAERNDQAASASARSDHDGDADSGSSTAYTEDNDTNDGGAKNNVADDGDNQHPSGKDRSVENGKSGTQGKAESDPDDDGRGPERTNGGPDKANGSGGVDKADQDGNNGCGNDDDFEDDNEGWCGSKPKQSKPEPKPETKPDAKPETKPCPDGSMTRPCSTKANTETKPKTGAKAKTDTKAKTESKPCPDGSMTRPCTKATSGNGTADVAVDAECRSVTVTSSKDISNVVVSFTDGTSTKFEGLRGGSWTRIFTQNVASATAKSATSVVTGMAGGCANTGTVLDQADTTVGGAFSSACPAAADELDGDGAMADRCAVAAGDDKQVVGEVLSGSIDRVRAASAEVPVRTVSARSNGQPLLVQLGSGVAAVLGGGAGAAALAFTGFEVMHLVAVALALTLLGAAMHWRARRTS